MTSPLHAKLGASAVFWGLFAGCAFLVLLPVWTVEYPAMIDLPQHAAQVAMWIRHDDPQTLEHATTRLNYFNPYLLAYVTTRLFASFMPVMEALKVVLSLALVALPFAFLALIHRAGGDRWWAFLAFPLAHGFSYHWGFVNFVLGVPIAVAFLALALGQSQRPTARGMAACLAVLVLTLFNHPLIFGFCGLAGGGMLLASAPDRSTAVRRAVLLCLPLPLVAAWLYAARSTEAMASIPATFDVGLHRFGQALAFQVALRTRLESVALGAVLLAMPFLFGARPTRVWWRWIPFAVAALLTLLGPAYVMGTAFVSGRYAAFLVPGLLIALEPRALGSKSRLPVIAHLALPLTAIVALLSYAGRSWAYDEHATGFEGAIAEMEPNRRVLYLPFEPRDSAIESPVYLHFGQWYAATRGGLVDFSFAQNFATLVRYRDGAMPALPRDFEWQPVVFDARRHRGDLYDYYVARTELDPTAWLTRVTGGRAILLVRAGEWWVFRNRR